MISKIKGIVEAKEQDCVHLQIANGITYEIKITKADFDLLSIDQDVIFYIHEIIKEDDNTLYGFLKLESKIWFQFLLKIDGLGPRTAIAILSNFAISEIKKSILNKDELYFLNISGIGKKISSRIVNEMSNNLQKIDLKIQSYVPNQENSPIIIENNDNFTNNLIQDSIIAIENLGFKDKKIYHHIQDIIKTLKEQNEKIEIANIIKYFLKNADNK